MQKMSESYVTKKVSKIRGNHVGKNNHEKKMLLKINEFKKKSSEKSMNHKKNHEL